MKCFHAFSSSTFLTVNQSFSGTVPALKSKVDSLSDKVANKTGFDKATVKKALIIGGVVGLAAGVAVGLGAAAGMAMIIPVACGQLAMGAMVGGIAAATAGVGTAVGVAVAEKHGVAWGIGAGVAAGAVAFVGANLLMGAL